MSYCIGFNSIENEDTSPAPARRGSERALLVHTGARAECADRKIDYGIKM